MIVQRTPDGVTPILICNVDHQMTAGQIARAFGNHQFRQPAPIDLMTYVVEYHEEGWRPIDAVPRRNPVTGLPYHLGDTPAELLIQKSRASPDFNEAHHPWCGLLSSMHAWGLYNGRYGVSDAVSIARPPDFAQAIVAMLDRETDRQDRLKATLAGNPETAPWVEPGHIFASYKLLEFFDTLALWWQSDHGTLRQPAVFRHVPVAVGEDLTLGIEPTGPHAARISPYPFNASPLALSCRLRVMEPASDEDFQEAFAGAVVDYQHYEVTA